MSLYFSSVLVITKKNNTQRLFCFIPIPAMAYKMSIRMRKPTICIWEDQLCTAAQLISAFVFATRIVYILLKLYPKFQDSRIYFLWLYRPVCVIPGRKPRLLSFSYAGANVIIKQQRRISNMTLVHVMS